MELEDDLEFCCRGGDRFLYYRGDSRRDSEQSALYLPVWSDRYLRHDLAGYLG